MVHEPIDRGRRRHLVANNPVPLTEHEVARHHDRPAFIPFREEREEHLGFIGTLLHVPQIVEQDHLEQIELPECPRQLQIALRAEQFLHQGVGRRVEHAVAGLDQRVADSTHRVALPDARQPEGEHVRRRVENVPVASSCNRCTIGSGSRPPSSVSKVLPGGSRAT